MLAYKKSSVLLVINECSISISLIQVDAIDNKSEISRNNKRLYFEINIVLTSHIDIE